MEMTKRHLFLTNHKKRQLDHIAMLPITLISTMSRAVVWLINVRGQGAIQGA